jgi:ribosome-associated toxin RatA of RatAB toxin-antitoxin module
MAIEGEASAVIHAPLERVYEVAADVEGSPRWQPEIKKAVCVERGPDGEQVLVDTETDGKVRTLKARLRFSYEPQKGLSWSQERGDLKSVEGSWRFEDLGDGTVRATYHLRVDFGRMLGAVMRGPVVDLLRKQMVDSMPDKLRRDVEG